MSEPGRGVIARVRFNHPPSGRGLESHRVGHLRWCVWQARRLWLYWQRPPRVIRGQVEPRQEITGG